MPYKISYFYKIYGNPFDDLIYKTDILYQNFFLDTGYLIYNIKYLLIREDILNFMSDILYVIFDIFMDIYYILYRI